ncbi:MAG: hypothetical protein JXA49_04085 [Actinobacteria bacterium]|nr:hypothetical protein [Actinomycetota bacterium]
MDSTQWIVFGIGMGVLVVGIFSIVMGVLARGKLNLMKETRTVSADTACNIGDTTGTVKVEVAGIAETDAPLVSPATNTSCIYFRHQVEQLEIDYDRDYDGDMRREERWVTVVDTKQQVPFMLRDSSGTVEVLPRDAKFEAHKTMGNQYGAMGLDVDIYDRRSDSVIGQVLDTISSLGGGATNRFRTSEWVIPAGERLYVLGSAIRQGERCVIGKGEGPFIVSTKSEEELTRKYTWTSMGWLVFGTLAAAGGVVAAIYALSAMGS